MQKSTFNLFVTKYKHDWRFFYISASFNVDGYTLTSYNDGRYTISFINGTDANVEREITKPIYDEFKSQYLKYVSQEHKIRRNIEHSELSDNTLYTRARNKPDSVEKVLENKELAKEVRKVIAALTKKQKKRFEMYYRQNLSYRQIAHIEGIYYTSVRDSIEWIRKKFKKLFK